MSILDDIKKIFTKNIKTKQAPITVYNNIGYSTPKRDSFIQYAQEGYEENAVVYKCVNEIANAASRVKINLFRGSQEIDEHPLLKLQSLLLMLMILHTKKYFFVPHLP